jgi:four helix bundle protein
MGLSSYRELEVWQVAMGLCEQVYLFSGQFPGEERFGLTSQVRRCSVSIPSNIAEGYARMHRGDYVRHLSIARGSLAELETQITLASRLKLVEREAAVPVWETTQRVGQMLTKLIDSLQE